MPTSILLRADQVIEEACLLQRMSLFYGTSRQFAAARNLVATGAQPTLVKPATNEIDL
jgi:hypothetical protein